jgi:predicted RNA-binding Zn ribbon-like protein
LNKKSLRLAINVSSWSILGTYFIAVATSCYPVALLDPSWQLNLTTNLVDNGGLALISLILFAFAASINPRDQQSYAAIFRWAIWPMLGFLLIPPLHLVGSIRLQEKVRIDHVSRYEKAGRRLEELASKLKAAGSSKDIDLILRRFQGNGLTAQQLNLPPNAIRPQLLNQLEEARSQLLQQIPSKQALQPLPLIINGTRIILSSLVYALAFAAMARRPRAQISLIEELTNLLETRRSAAQARHRERQAFLKTIADSQLEQQALAAAQEEQSATMSEAESEEIQEMPAPANQDPVKPESSTKHRRGVDLDYFEALSQDSEAEDSEKSV